MARFVFETPSGPLTVHGARDEADARRRAAAQFVHPDPDGSGDGPYTPAEIADYERRLAEFAAALQLQQS